MIETPAVVSVLRRHRYNYSNEKDLQEGIEQALLKNMIPFEREKILVDKHGTIDFLIDGRIGLEIKIKGSPSSVARQLARYLDCSEVSELVLVTGRALLGRLPVVLRGKKLTVVNLWETFL